MKVAGGDLSTKRIGLALPDGRIVSVAPKAKAAEPARRLDELESTFVRWLRTFPPLPDVVVLEGYLPHTPGVRATIALAEIGGVVRLALYRLGIPYVEIAPSALKRAATGNGAATKEQMIAAAVAAGAHAEVNDDEADAYHLRHLGLVAYGHAVGSATELEIAAAVTWPGEVTR